MGLARALGFDLCPRLSHLRDRRLHVPRNHEVPQQLAAVTDRDVRLELIVDVWDEFVRIAASIRSGKCTAVDALARFGSAARGQAVYEGGRRRSRRTPVQKHLSDRLFHQCPVQGGNAACLESWRSRPQRSTRDPYRQDTCRTGTPSRIALGGLVRTDASLEYPDGVEHHAYATRS